MRLASPVLLLLLLAPGCIFYSGDDDDCYYGGGGREPGADYYDPGQRNPDTGECVYFGGGGGGQCDACGNCPPGAEDGLQAPAPTWGSCESQCTGLDELTCLETSACRAIYSGGDALAFADCWAVDQTGPIQGGGCEGLDATTCSMHDDCAAVHLDTCATGGGDGDGDAPEPVPCGGIGAFGYCMAEGNEPDPGSCEGEVMCDATPPECPDGSTPGIADGCYTGYCIPLADCEGAPACGEIGEEASCVERADCTPIYEGVDCVCDEVDCTCADWVFESCE